MPISSYPNSKMTLLQIAGFLMLVVGGLVYAGKTYCLEPPSIILSTDSQPISDTTKWYTSLHFSDDQQFLLATSARRIDVWNIETGEIVRSFSSENFNVIYFNSISVTNGLSKFLFLHPGDYNPIHAIMVDSTNGNVLWQIESEPSDYFTSHLYLPTGGYTTRTGYSLLAPDGKTAIVYFQWDKAEREYIWADGQTGVIKNTLTIENAYPIKIFPDNRRLLAVGGREQPYVRIYDLNSGEIIQEYPNAVDAKLTVDGSKLYVANSEKNEIRVYNTENSEIEKQFGNLSNLGDNFQITPYGDRLLYGGSLLSVEGFMVIGRFDYDEENKIGNLFNLRTLIGRIYDIDLTRYEKAYVLKGLSEDGKYAYLVIRETNTIWLWDFEELGLSGVVESVNYR